jgi:predicted dehydrogenase
MFALAIEKKLLLTEAIWTRYMPLRKTLDDIITSGVIGNVSMLTANLGYVINHKVRLTEPSLAGGALLDVGVYTLNFALMAFGTEIERITSTAVITDKGVDAQNSITLVYKDGKMAVLNSTMLSLTDRQGIISGNKGFIVAENINNCQSLRVYDLNRKEIAYYEAPKQISGYEYEVSACIRAIQEGKLECEEMPHTETKRVMRIMDDLRKEWGVIYPGE